MRLSDAIATGRTLLIPTAYVLNDGDGHGCAWGMALASRGNTWWPGDIDTWEWSWTQKHGETPCGCSPTRNGEREMPPRWIGTYHDNIVHIFNEHVMGKLKPWTLDQLIDYVRANEPAEAVEAAEEKTIAESAPSLVAQG